MPHIKHDYDCRKCGAPNTAEFPAREMIEGHAHYCKCGEPTVICNADGPKKMLPGWTPCKTCDRTPKSTAHCHSWLDLMAMRCPECGGHTRSAA